MPREQVTHNPDLIVTESTLLGDSSMEVTAHGRNLHVGWNAEAGWVQVSVELGTRDLEQLATPSPDVGYANDKQMVWSDVMTRRDINATIAALRKARDKAYGRDE